MKQKSYCDSAKGSHSHPYTSRINKYTIHNPLSQYLTHSPDWKGSQEELLSSDETRKEKDRKSDQDIRAMTVKDNEREKSRKRYTIEECSAPFDWR